MVTQTTEAYPGSMLGAVERTLGELLSGRARLERSIDWASLVTRAVEERVAPLLYSKLAFDPVLPGAAGDALRTELYRSEAWNLLQYRGLARLLERGAPAGADPPVLLKGAALAATLYDEIGHRPMGDVDLLVSRADLPRWIDRAHEASFRRVAPEMGRGLDESIHYHLALAAGPANEERLEIHYGLIAGESDWRSPDPGWFLDRAEAWRAPEPFSSLSARELDPTAHLLYLAAHAMLQHGGRSARMIWFHDMHLVVSKRGARVLWSELLERAKAFEWDAALDAALGRTAELFGTPLPAGLREELASPSGGRGLREVGRRSRSHGRAGLVWDELRSASPKRGVLWALAILFPRPEYMRWRYPGAGRFWPALYPYRWARVFWEGASALFRWKMRAS